MPQAVIMAGGQGERFWPMTHAGFPKYRIKFDGKRSLLQGTYDRLARIFPKGSISVVTTRQHARMIREELPFLRAGNLIIEPFRNNTAAAILLSTALAAKKSGPEEIVSFFPADHLIRDERAFGKTISGAMHLAQKTNTLVTIGITPTFPATGYGYIRCGKPIRGFKKAYRAARFVEKPNHQRALFYMRDGSFLWNAGIFTWRSGVFMEAMARHCPRMIAAFDVSRIESSYRRLESQSIDYALLEKAENIAVCRTEMDWCDLGNWDRLLDMSKADSKGNVKTGASHHEDARGCLLINEHHQPLVTAGLRDLVVVQTPQGTLICRRGSAEEAALLFKKI